MSQVCAGCFKSFKNIEALNIHEMVCDVPKQSQGNLHIVAQRPSGSTSVKSKKKVLAQPAKVVQQSKANTTKATQPAKVVQQSILLKQAATKVAQLTNSVQQVSTSACEAPKSQTYGSTYGFFPLCEASDLISTKILKAIGLAINTELNLFICLVCQTAHNAGSICEHMKRIHSESGWSFYKADLIKIAEAADISTTYPTMKKSREPCYIYSGLEVFESSGCPHCHYAANRKAVLQHMKLEHSTEGGTPENNILTQVITHSTAGHRHIRVKHRTQTTQSAVTDPLLNGFENFDWKAFMDNNSSVNARMVSPWLMRTGWHKHIMGKDVPTLCQQVSYPKEDIFSGLHEAIAIYFNKATALIDVTDTLVLQILNSPDPVKKGINNTPLHPHHQADTIKEYIVIIVHLVAAMLRPNAEAYTFPTSPSLDIALGRLQAWLGTESDLDGQNLLHEVFLDLWKTEWRTSKHVNMPDPTLCFLALHTLQETGEFKAPKDITGDIAKLCKAIQLVMVKTIHNLVDSGEAIHQEAAMQLLQDYVVENKSTTFASLMSLQHYASALAWGTMSLPRIWWLDRENWSEMLYKGQKITYNNILEMFQKLEDHIVYLWEEKVMLGSGLYIVHEILSDNMCQTEKGYSLIMDQQNPFSQHFKDLGKHIIQTPHLHKQFLIHIPGTSTLQWNILRCRQWLMDLAELEGCTMISAEWKSGAPIRMTELVSTLMLNTGLRTRNGFGMGRFMTIVRQYDKTTNNNQADRLIPHALCAFDGDMLLQIHTLARPFAQYLASIVFPNQEHLVVRYAEMMFMDFGKEFSSAKASGLMGKWSSSVVGWEVTVSAWRHINIAWKRKLCKGSLDLEIETEIMSPIHILQAGHGAHTENYGYGISPDALNGISEDVIFLYCEASGLYQTRFKTVPGGLGLTYKQARMHHFDSLVMQGVVNLRDKSQSQDSCTVGVTALHAEFAENQKKMLSHLENMQNQLLCLKQDFNQVNPQNHIPDPCTPPINTMLPQEDSIVEVACTSFQQQPIKKIYSQNSFSEVTSASTQSTLFSSQHQSNKSSSIPQSPLSVEAIPLHSQSANFNQQDMLYYLRHLYGPEAQWKIQEQRDAIEALLKLQGDVVVALPTGIGKTAIAILPSFVECGHTIIILPLIALKEDWIRRLTDLNVPFEHYDGSSCGHLKGY